MKSKANSLRDTSDLDADHWIGLTDPLKRIHSRFRHTHASGTLCRLK